MNEFLYRAVEILPEPWGPTWVPMTRPVPKPDAEAEVRAARALRSASTRFEVVNEATYRMHVHATYPGGQR